MNRGETVTHTGRDGAEGVGTRQAVGAEADGQDGNEVAGDGGHGMPGQGTKGDAMASRGMEEEGRMGGVGMMGINGANGANGRKWVNWLVFRWFGVKLTSGWFCGG